MYNEHKNYNHWNVCLWLNNDEGLYRMARRHTRRGTKAEAASNIMRELEGMGITHTPDGARYSYSAVRAAIAGDF